jgi:hypothetical protein
VKYSVEIFNPDEELTVGLKNLESEMLAELSKEESVAQIFDIKFYMYGVYDRVQILGREFMVLKSSKKNVVLLGL